MNKQIICDEPDNTIKANCLVYLREDDRGIAGFPFANESVVCWTDWNVIQECKTEKRREELENCIGCVNMIDLFYFERFIYWGF